MIDILEKSAIITIVSFAGVAELADAQASGACGSNIVWVQVPSPAFFFCLKNIMIIIKPLLSSPY